jgi:hypothetical protein
MYFGVWEGRTLSDLWVDEPASAAAWEGDGRVAMESWWGCRAYFRIGAPVTWR